MLFLALTCVLAHAAAQTQASPTELIVPANTAYGVPDREALKVTDSGIESWSDAAEHIQWHGHLLPGTYTLAVDLRIPAGERVRLSMTCNMRTHEIDADGLGGETVRASFGSFKVDHDGYQTVDLKGVRRSGATFGDVLSLDVRGEGVRSAQFNLKPRRNTASVHFRYPFDSTFQPVWFYNEVTARTDPVNTYYEVCGFARGYFGMQVNGADPSDRRIIFSVWDAGKTDDPKAVLSGDSTVLVAKGDGVVASTFGGEGTGGHSHLRYAWVKGQTYRFLVGAVSTGSRTQYTGYFFDNAIKKWVLIASFSAAKDGGLLRDLYSFDEDFDGANGDLERRAEFGNAWIGSADGQWRALRQAVFTHDATGSKDRFDYLGYASEGRFVLRTGGFIDGAPTPSGSMLIRSDIGHPPTDITLPPIPPSGH